MTYSLNVRWSGIGIVVNGDFDTEEEFMTEVRKHISNHIYTVETMSESLDVSLFLYPEEWDPSWTIYGVVPDKLLPISTKQANYNRDLITLYGENDDNS